MSNLTNYFATFSHNLDLIVLAKLLLTCLLGGIIGLEREIKRKPVGIKTCIIISVTTCILTIVSIQAAEYYATLSDNIRTDPMRLAAQVISGIGFIGTGVILHKNNDMISGITTAAMIWTTAGVGITVGAGFYSSAIAVSIIIILTLKYSGYLRLIVPKRKHIHRINLVLDVSCDLDVDLISQRLSEKGCQIRSVALKDKKDGNLTLTINAHIAEDKSFHQLYQQIKTMENVHSAEVKYFH